MDHIICHFEIPADNVQTLAGFYTELFGWRVTAVPGMEDAYWFVRPSADESVLAGGMTTREAPDQGILNYVLVEDVDAYAARAQELGATILVGKTEVPGMGWFAIMNDPQGNRLGIFEPHPDSMPGQA